jgi:ubiquitin carboxyl-terminal hydrolase L3
MADEAATETFNWPPLESNPDIFTKYMHEVGLSKEW